jgi:ribosomal protein L40E
MHHKEETNMKCGECGSENPKHAKFCRKCGTSLGIRLQCVRCGAENPGDSVFCTECGERLSEAPKSAKGTQKKCKSCGQLNDLDALFCVACGEEIIRAPREDQKGQPSGPSYKMIALVIGLIFLLGFFVKVGTTFFKAEKPSSLSSSLAPVSKSMINVDEAQVIAVAKNFKCPCGGCGEDALETCSCDMPKGAVETKSFIREKLSEGFTVEQVIESVDKKYGHRI